MQKGVERMDEVLQAIGTVGFPIVMALLELWYIVTRMDKMTDIIANNTQALKELTIFLDKDGDDDGKKG